MYDGHETEVRDACRDGVGIGDQDIGLKKSREGYSWDLGGETYTLQVAVHNVGVVEIPKSFNGVRELKDVGKR